MSALALAAKLLLVAAPALLVVLHARRSQLAKGTVRWVAASAGLGALFFALANLALELVAGWAGLDLLQDELSKLLFTALCVAPIAGAAQVGAVYPFWRAKLFRTPYGGALFPLAASSGFIGAKSFSFLWGEPLGAAVVARCVVAIAGYLCVSLLWGFPMGKERRRRLGGRLFNVTFLIAVASYAIFDTLAFSRGLLALAAAIPPLILAAIIASLLIRDLHRRSTGTAGGRTRRFLQSIQPPSLRAMRDALRRTERPLMLTWIAFGALVTSGVITASVAGAVLLGHRLGVDFAAVDRSESAAAAMPPLALLGLAILLSFPVAGFLVARASSTRTVLEPALSAALAIAAVLILLGFAAPVAVVFAIACAPVAFSLACAGAWVGVTR